MKKEKRSKLIQSDVWIASDGQEFETEFLCKVHEEELKESRMCEIADQCPHFAYAPPRENDKTYLWALCKTEEELEAIVIRYLNNGSRTRDVGNLSQIAQKLPCHVVVIYDTWGWGNIYLAEDVLGEFSKFIESVKKSF